MAAPVHTMPPGLSIPVAEASDSEQVVLQLETAQMLFDKGDTTEALRWLRRASVMAAEDGDDVRALALARAAADLTTRARSAGSVPPPKAERSSVAPPRHTSAPPPKPSRGLINGAAPSVPPSRIREVVKALPSVPPPPVPPPPPLPRSASTPPPAPAPTPTGRPTLRSLPLISEDDIVVQDEQPQEIKREEVSAVVRHDTLTVGRQKQTQSEPAEPAVDLDRTKPSRRDDSELDWSAPLIQSPATTRSEPPPKEVPAAKRTETSTIVRTETVRPKPNVNLDELVEQGRAVRVFIKRSVRDDDLFIVRRMNSEKPPIGARTAVVVLGEHDSEFFAELDENSK